MLHITIGLFLIALGVWGVFDEWYYVVDCVKGGTSVFLTLGGLSGILAGLVRPKGTLNTTGDTTGHENTSGFEGGER